MIALLLALACTLGGQGEPGHETPAARTLREWREEYQLDRLERILADGPRLTSGTGALAHDGGAVALVARALHAAGKEGLARSLLASAEVRDADGRAQIDLARAELCLAEDDQAGALSILLDPETKRVRLAGYADAWWLAGQALVRAGASAEARPLLLRFVELAPCSSATPSAYHMLAQDALATGELERAREWRAASERWTRWQELWRTRMVQIRAEPEAFLPRLGLAQLWLEAGQHAQAREVLAELVRLHPEQARAWSLLGECERLLSALPAAKAAWDEALRLDPSLTPARFNRAVLARLQGRLEQARDDFRWIVEHERDDRLRLERARTELAALEGKPP